MDWGRAREEVPAKAKAKVAAVAWVTAVVEAVAATVGAALERAKGVVAALAELERAKVRATAVEVRDLALATEAGTATGAALAVPGALLTRCERRLLRRRK